MKKKTRRKSKTPESFENRTASRMCDGTSFWSVRLFIAESQQRQCNENRNYFSKKSSSREYSRVLRRLSGEKKPRNGRRNARTVAVKPKTNTTPPPQWPRSDLKNEKKFDIFSRVDYRAVFSRFSIEDFLRAIDLSTQWPDTVEFRVLGGHLSR